MSYVDRIRQSADPREAMLVIAEGLDEVLERLAAGSLSRQGSDGWGSWGGGAASARPAAAPQPTKPEDFYAAKQADPDYAGMERIQSTIDKLEARPMTPANQALLEQAYTALEKASRPGEYLDNSGGIVGSGGAYSATETADGGYVIDLPPVDERRKAMRQELAERIDLPGFFPPLMRTTEDQRQQIIRAYVLGGPRWLYANRITDGDHDIFDQLPVAAKTVMVVDLQQDDTREAWEFQRDIMKTEDVEGTTLNIAKDNIDGISDGPRTELRG